MSDEQWVPGSKSELMTAVKREWKLLMDVVSKLEKANKLTTRDAGGWSPKDNLAHLAEWMNSLHGHHLELQPRHEVMRISEDLAEKWDLDAINSILFERNRERSTQVVLDELKQVYLKLYNKLDTMSFEDLLKPRDADDPEKRPLLMWVLGDTTEHFEEHRSTIEKML